METKLTPEQRERFFAEIRQKSDVIIRRALIAHFLFGLFLGYFYDTYVIAVLVGGLCLAAYFVTKMLLPKHTLYQYVASGLLAIFTAQFIYQMHGLFEMYFFVFLGTTLLITYQNWKLQLPLILLVGVHHATFAYLQYSGNKEIYFTQLDYMSLQAFLFHGALAVVISGICGYWAYDLEKKTEENALQTISTEAQLLNVTNNIAFANEISKGNLTVDYKLLDESDELGKSLMAMRKNLVNAAQREQEEKFITVGITKVGDIIRQNNDNVKKLAEEFIIGTVKYLGINQGALFLHDDENGQEFLELIACYAYERKKFLNKRVGIGEGLLGQCFLEKEQVYMTKVPDEYTHITSGLGGATPGSVLLMPLMTNESIVGVMELASFKPFTKAQIEFIKTAAENIAASIVSSRTTERVKRLLQESQQQAEEMKAQEEEMRQNMEELQATQEEMGRKNADVERLLNEASAKEERLQKQLDEVSVIKKDEERKSQEQLKYIEGYKKTLLGILDRLPHEIFLKDHEGKMVMVNTAVAQAHNKGVDELIGKTDFDFVDAATAQEWRNQELEIIKKGSESYVHEDSIAGKVRVLKTVKSAFFIPHLNQTGLLGIQTDITDESKKS